MASNMLLCRVWAALTRTLKKTKLRRKPNTTEVAVKPDQSREKKNPSAHYNAILVVSYAFKVPVLSMLNGTKKAYLFYLCFSFNYAFFVLNADLSL